MRAPNDFAQTQPGAYSAFFDPNDAQNAAMMSSLGFGQLSAPQSAAPGASSSSANPMPTFTGFNNLDPVMQTPQTDGLGAPTSPYQNPYNAGFMGLLNQVRQQNSKPASGGTIITSAAGGGN